MPDTLGACRLSLFRISQDESTKTGAFLPAPSNTTVAADGILVVACSLWFDFSRVNKSVGEQWGILYKFADLFYANATAPHFAIDTPGAGHFKRVAVLFQPRFEFGPYPSPAMTSADASLIVSVRETAGAPVLTAGSPPTLDVLRNDVGMWIMRYALQENGSTLPPAIDNTPLTTADLATLVTHLRDIAQSSNLDPTPPPRALGTPFAYA